MENDLENMIIQMILEQQVKLGYEKETVRLYLPSSTLEGILKTKDLHPGIRAIIEETEERWGKVKVTRSGMRFCIAIPPKGCEYIHTHYQASPFLKELIELFRHHGITIEQVKELFGKYDSSFICEKQDGEEFDYLLRFSDLSMDSFYYLVKFDGPHASYHRFTEYDIRELGF